MKKVNLLIFLFFASFYAKSQQSMNVKYFYPKDSLAFEESTDIEYQFNKEKMGKTTMIIHAETPVGFFEFVFKKKIHKVERFGGDSSDVFGHKPDGTWGVVYKSYNPPTTYSIHDIYALILLQDHGGTIEKAIFKDFGNEVYWPNFDYNLCSVSDEDKNGSPEFYLSYLAESDGLDAKEFKQIIYTFPENQKEKSMIKSKATAFYPAGNEEDVYRIEKDLFWKNLNPAIQKKSLELLKKHKINYLKN
jgi:hypothetical protein